MPSQILDFLASLSIFQSLDRKTLAELAALFEAKKFTSNERILSAGTEGHDFFIVWKGSVSVTRERNGQTAYVATINEGAYFGEAALFDSYKRIADVSAVGEVELFVTNQGKLMTYLQSHPATGTKVFYEMLRAIFQRLERMTREMETIHGNGLDQSDIDELLSQSRNKKAS